MALTNKEIVAAKAKEKPYKLTDGNGLYLYVATSGSKTWRANFIVGGKQKTATFGQYPEISLAAARQLNADRKVSQAQAPKCPTFREVAEEWLPIKQAQLDNEKHKLQYESTLREYVYPFIGHLPINDIKRTKLVEVVKNISHISETAHRVAGRIRMVFDYAQDCGLIDMHAAADLTRVLAPVKSTPMLCIKPEEAPALFAAIETYNEPITRLALKLVAHTFVRTTELRGMQWDEVNFKDRVWVIPEGRMKKRIPHVVPLTDQSIAILRELQEYTSASGIVVESPQKPGTTVSENTMLFALYRLGYRGKMTVHGFRALASTVLNHETQFDADVIERQLSHQEKDDVRASYNRAQYLPQRRELMKWWSNWIESQYKL